MEKILENKDLVKNEILSKCKVDEKSKVLFILDLAKIDKKRGRKPYEEMSDEELYNLYVKKCERQNRPVSWDLGMWRYMTVVYDYEDLLNSDDLDENNARIESKADKLGYIGDELDYEAFNSLYRIFFKALKKRLVIILNLESVIGILDTALACRYHGYDCKNINLTMNNKIEEVRNLVKNPDVKEWLSTGASDMSFDPDDYVNTYQRVLRQLTNIKDERLEYVKDIIHNEEDLFEEQILDNELFDFQNYSDYLEYNENECED